MFGRILGRKGGGQPSMSRRDFRAATRLAESQVDRFEAEGLLRTHWERAVGGIVDNAAEFIRTVMKPAGADWPPVMPVLDGEGQAAYARAGGDDEGIAASVLAPFEYRVLDEDWHRIVRLARPSVRLVADGPAEVGMSKLGGTPDMPPAFPWPRCDGVPLGFVAQVNLGQVQSVSPVDRLPPSGILSFFYDARQEVWGFDPKDRGRWAVHHFEGIVVPAHEPADLEPDGSYRGVGLRPVGELTLPEPDSREVEILGLTSQQQRAYEALTTELAEARDEPIHRLWGWPESIQHDPAAEVQLPAHGLYAGDGTAYRTEEGQRLMQERGVWNLLLQVDSDDACGMMWGDAGRLYYMIRGDDLAARHWDACWFDSQCC